MELIGRDAELGHVGQRLQDRRLVTIVGPGGIGKTALAHAAAEQAATTYEGGARFVDLTRIDTQDGVLESLATQLGYGSYRSLIESPSDIPVLVVVDNCEHVLDAVAVAVEELLEVCQMPTVLATSRAALEVPGETVVPLGPLGLPPVGALDAPAVRLFVERARDAGHDVERSEPVAELCRRLDGMPLAIELAAARMRAMTPDEVLARLTVDLDVLDRPRRRSAPRHQSLRAAIDWSYELLAPAEQELFDRLSIFPGSFDADLAHAVAGRDDESPRATQDRLDGLVATSMVVADRDGAAMRYRVLETLRAYGRSRLEPAAAATLQARFADHTVAQVADVITRGATGWAADALADLRSLYDSTAAVIRWCVAHDDEPDRAVLLVAALWGIVHQAHTEDVDRLASAVLARWPDSDAPLVADAIATAATCRYMLGDLDGAIELAEGALPEAERSPYAGATLRRAVAQARRAAGDAAGALEWFEATELEARRLGLAAMAMESQSARAQILADLGRGDEGLELLGTVRAEALAAGADVLVAWTEVVEGSILLRTDRPRAQRALEGALASCEALLHHAGTSVTQRSLAIGALLDGRHRDAAEHVLALLDGLLELGSTYELRMALDVGSAVTAATGRRAPAADLAATALTLPVVSITASIGYELIEIDPSGGRPRTTRDAILLLRSEMEAVLADDGPASSPTSPVGRGTFRRVGEVWEVGLGDQRATVKGSKGMDDLATLLDAAGREVHSLELVGAGLAQGDAGPAIDATARRAYEGRVRELQAAIDEADEHHDRGRADRARLELDALVDELTASLGLGGRARSTGSSAERARSAVTQRIRATIRRLAVVDPPLGRHLQASVRTGTFCSYGPEHPVGWER